MFFGKKSRDTTRCDNCSSKLDKRFSFCPYCGNSLFDEEDEMEEFGMLGRTDADRELPAENLRGFGITDKLINSVMNSLIKNLNREISKTDEFNAFGRTEIKTLPNGIKIKLGVPPQSPNKLKKRKTIYEKAPSDEQLEKMASLPRAAAKTTIKRFSDKMIYELNASGVQSVEDIFVSKLESGYEIKAIGEKKVYVNTLPISLPLQKFSIESNRIIFEFKTEE